MNTDKTTVTINEVAIEAGVSIASVSRALNSRSGISETTKIKILAACEHLGYIPDRSAVTLASRGSNVIGICFSKKEDIISRYTGMLLPFLTKSLSQSGLTPLPIVQDLSNISTFKAVILVGLKSNDQRIKELIDNNIPFVCIGMGQCDYSVCPDDKNGIKQAVEHLIELNRTKIAFVSQNLMESVMITRFNAYLETMNLYSLDPECVFIEDGFNTEIQTYRFFMSLSLDVLSKYNGLVCFSDEIASAAVTALRDRGIRVPEDISIVGFDGIIGVSDGITTIKQDFKSIADNAVRLINKASDKKQKEQTIVPVELIEANSTVR